MNKLYGAMIIASLCAYGCGGECEDLTDCPNGNICNEESMCVPRTQPPGGRPDGGGFDGGRPDNGLNGQDLGVDMGGDTGVNPGDGGMEDLGAGDAGPQPDMGNMIPDMGPVMGTMLPSDGLVWIGEYRTANGPAFTAFGEFEDRSNVTYASTRMTYNGPAGEVCELVSDRVVSGLPVGIDASTITIEAGPSPHASLIYMRTAPGRFAPDGNLTGSLFAFATMSSFSIVSSQMPNTLANAQASVDAPLELNASLPTLGQAILLDQGVTVSWMQNTVGPMSADLVLEVRNLGHSSSLRCVLVPGTGSFTIPSAAIMDWRLTNPQPPFYVELSNSSESTMNVQILGGGSLPVRYRASWGLRWDAE